MSGLKAKLSACKAMVGNLLCTKKVSWRNGFRIPASNRQLHYRLFQCRVPRNQHNEIIRCVAHAEAGSDPRGHLGVTWGVYLCARKPPLADIILSHPTDLTRCDSVIGLAIPAMSGHIQYRGAASGDLYIRISGINRVLLS